MAVSELDHCVDRSFSYRAISERAADVASSLKVDVCVRRLSTVRIDMADGRHRSEWGMFVAVEDSVGVELFLVHGELSEADDGHEDDDAEAYDASEDVRREIESELWQDTDAHQQASESGWIYSDDDQAP